MTVDAALVAVAAAVTPLLPRRAAARRAASQARAGQLTAARAAAAPAREHVTAAAAD